MSTTSDVNTTTSNPYPVANIGAISTPTVVNSSPSTAAGARTDYVITFNTSSTGGMSGTAHSQITITFPATATTPFNTTTIVNAIVTDTTTSTQVGTCGVSSQTVEVCTITAGKTVTAGDTLTVELDGVTTESPAPTGNTDTLSVSTTSDTTTKTSSTYPVTNGRAITAPRVDNTSPSTAAGARTDYVMTFTTSSTGGMSGTAHSQITITFPATATTPFNTTTIVNAIVTDATTSTQVGTCGVSSQTVEVCTIAAGKTVTAGDVLKIELDGVTTESPAPNGNLHTLTVSTTSDTTTMTSVTFPVANSGSISAPTVQLSNFTAGAHANYTIAFNTSASGGMSGTAHSQITITLPATSSTLSVTNAVVMDAGVQVGTCGVSSQIVEVCTISAGETVNPGDQVTVALSGVTNPSNVSMSSTLTVQTTSDVAPQTSGPYQGSGPPPPTITAISPSSGPASGGAGVMITGTNLTGATAVDFGANGATNVTVVDSSHITATSPPGSGTVDVTV
ncbi:MAG: IPT/TIG domain-containing protein, partial [Solirubrobacteraceae bacterium]